LRFKEEVINELLKRASVKIERVDNRIMVGIADKEGIVRGGKTYLKNIYTPRQAYNILELIEEILRLEGYGE